MDSLDNIAKKIVTENSTMPIEELIALKAGNLPWIIPYLRRLAKQLDDQAFRKFCLFTPNDREFAIELAEWILVKLKEDSRKEAGLEGYAKAKLASLG